MAQLLEFRVFSGLKVDEKKSFALLKQQMEALPARYVGLRVKERVRYLGVQIGLVNAEQADAPSMAKMKEQAAILKTLPLELSEKAVICMICKIWIQLVAQLTAKVYNPLQKVLSAFNVIFRMVLGLSTWDLSPAWQQGH